MEKKKLKAINTSNLKKGVPTRIIGGNHLQSHKGSKLPGADDPITFLIEDFMEHRTFNSIIGASKSGKSMLALQMAFCVQNGLPFLGHEVDQGDVLYVDFELRPNHIKKRIDAVKQYYNLPEADDPIYLSLYEDFTAGRIDFEGVITKVKDELSKNNDIKLVIFDCFYAWAQGARNQEGNVKSQLMPLKFLVTDYNVAVTYVHHTCKGGVKKNPTVNDIINAAGGSGVHGKIVDTTYVVYPLGRSTTTFMIASGGRAIGCSDTTCEKSAETNYFFNNLNEETQETVGVDVTLCETIAKYIEETGAKDLRSIKDLFSVTNETLRAMGFGIDPKAHRIYLDRSKLCSTTYEDEFEDEDDVASDVNLSA